MPIKTLVFTVGCPEPKDLPPPSECLIVPLYSELVLDGRLSAWNFNDTQDCLGIQEHHEILVESEKVWQNIIGSNDGLNLEDYSQFFFCTITPILFWKNLIQKAIEKHKPLELIIPFRDEKSALVVGVDLFKERDRFLKFMAYSVLEYECRNYGLKIRFASELVKHKESILAHSVNNLSQFCSYILRNGLSNAYRKVINRLFKYDLSLKIKDAPVGVLFITQSKKSERLYTELVSKKIRVGQINYDEFCNFFMPIELSKRSTLTFGSSCIKGDIYGVLAEWIYFSAKFHKDHVQNKIDQWIDRGIGLILTDGEHDYLIRKLMRSLDSRKRNFFILPEGAGNIVSKDQIRAENILSDRGLFAWRVLCSRYQLDVYKKLFHSKEKRIIGGYFLSYKNFPSSPKKYSRLLKGHKIFTGKKPVIFLDMYLFNMHGIERPIFQLPFDQQLRIIDSFLDAVDLDRYAVVANLRHQNFLEALQNRYQDKITIFIDVGWLDLAQYSSLVVTRSSSICSEALFLKIPALIWNPFPEFPDIFESFECIRSPVLQRATNREELTLCMEFLNQKTIQDFDAYTNYISEEINMQHVLETALALADTFE